MATKSLYAGQFTSQMIKPNIYFYSPTEAAPQIAVVFRNYRLLLVLFSSPFVRLLSSVRCFVVMPTVPFQWTFSIGKQWRQPLGSNLQIVQDSRETKGPPQTRLDHFFVVDNKKLSMTKHLVCELSYRLQTVKIKSSTTK